MFGLTNYEIKLWVKHGDNTPSENIRFLKIQTLNPD